ncbi:phosphoglycolate phosphatase [Seohaeicola saemankumensis]|uniref:phosphoglycolate phosphatase n=1 Tax=Seohaeicola TaxID=481178 RepID=UPI0035CFA538|nr:phosphoglycolate phosphatase [Paracoccaceae bacterium]
MSAIVFDLDGTLIDSAPDIRAAVNRTLEGEGHAPLDLPTVVSFIGHGLPNLVAKAMVARGIDMDDHARLTGVTLAHYNAASNDLTRPYPGMMAVLERLRRDGHRLGICTNKPEGPARKVLDQFGMAHLFDTVVGGDTLAVRKPDPAPLHHAFAALGAASGLYVGDSEVDADTARAAAVPFAFFTQGYCHIPHDDVTSIAQFDHFDALPGIVADMSATAPDR